ncbi:MAG: heavy-metal-associated domain-containing protein [Anaerolineales bacterium]
MREETFKIEGMSCQMCVKHVTKALQGVAGVSAVEVSLEDEAAQVSYDPDVADVAAFKAAVSDAGYKLVD